MKYKEFLKIDPQKCLQLYDKLLDIEKKLAAPDNKIDEGKIGINFMCPKSMSI